MGMQWPHRGRKVRFADFEVDFRTGVLRRRGVLIPIQGKPVNGTCDRTSATGRTRLARRSLQGALAGDKRSAIPLCASFTGPLTCICELYP
jgi:hypothetical protein